MEGQKNVRFWKIVLLYCLRVYSDVAYIFDGSGYLLRTYVNSE